MDVRFVNFLTVVAQTTNETGYEHTPILVGLIEFVIHDIAWSIPSQKVIAIVKVTCKP